ncbi:MAG: hypothetical protein ACRDTA_15570 [Pseudonocardiaceae bacterium]
MEHERIQPRQNTADLHLGDDQDQQQQFGIIRSIRPGTALPTTVLLTDMGDGALFLQGWRDGPSAYLSPSDAVPLRRQWAGDFGSTELTPSNGQDEAL